MQSISSYLHWKVKYQPTQGLIQEFSLEGETQTCAMGTCMYQCTRWGFVDFIDIQDIFSMALFQGLCHLEYLTASSVLIYRRKSREIFPCAVLINVRMTRADRCLLKQ